MRTLFVLIAALTLTSCSKQSQICGRMETLCGTERADCEALVKSTQENFGDEGVAGLHACFSDARSCNEASGCVAGKGLKALGDAMGEFLQGVKKGLEDKK